MAFSNIFVHPTTWLQWVNPPSPADHENLLPSYFQATCSKEGRAKDEGDETRALTSEWSGVKLIKPMGYKMKPNKPKPPSKF